MVHQFPSQIGAELSECIAASKFKTCPLVLMLSMCIEIDLPVVDNLWYPQCRFHIHPSQLYLLLSKIFFCFSWKFFYMFIAKSVAILWNHFCLLNINVFFFTNMIYKTSLTAVIVLIWRHIVGMSRTSLGNFLYWSLGFKPMPFCFLNM